MGKSLRELLSNVIVFDVGKSQLEKLFEEVLTINKKLRTILLGLPDFEIFHLMIQTFIICKYY